MTYPGNRVAKNEKTSKNNHRNRCAGSPIRSLLVQTEMTNRAEDQKAHHHPSTTAHERLASTKVLNNVQAEEGAGKIDTVQNHLSDERRNLYSFEDCLSKFVSVSTTFFNTFYSLCHNRKRSLLQ